MILKSRFFSVILFCIIFLTACQQEQITLFPLENEAKYPLNEVEHSKQVGFDFYIQSTPSMEGFVTINLTQRESAFYKTIPLLYTASLNSAWSAANITSTKFYRFDVGNDDRFADEISDSEFKVDSLINPNNQESDFYSNFGEKEISSEYLAPVINELNTENISIIITDMVDYNARTDNVAKALCRIIDDGLAIALFGVMSNFDGDIFIGETGYVYGGSFRPFYVLAIGRDVDVYNYARSLKRSFDDPDKKIDYNFEFISATQLAGVATNTDLNKELFSLSPGITEVFESQLVGSELDMFAGKNNIFYYNLGKNEKMPYDWISFKAPLKLKFDLNTSLTLKTDFILEELVTDEAEVDGRYSQGVFREVDNIKRDGILCITEHAVSQGFDDEILTTAVSDILDSNEYIVDIVFDKSKLKDNDSKAVSKYKLSIKTFISDDNDSFTTPQWIKDFSYNKRIDQYYSELVDSVEREGDRAGQFTLGLREIIDPVLNTVRILQNDILISDFSFYFRY